MGCSTSTLEDEKLIGSKNNMEPSKQKKAKLFLDSDSDDSDHHQCGFCQSPIDISNNCNFGTTKMMKEKDLKSNPLRFDYPKQVKNCSILNNGYTVQINIGKENKCTVSVHGKTYTLAQFHFHTPSEHMIDGKQHEMEMHLVHLSDKGEIAVLGFLFLINPDNDEDEPNEFLDQFWSQLPSEKTSADIPLENPLSFECLFATLREKMSETPRTKKSNKFEIDMEIYEYMGSLTTPPYTEGVQWLVSKKLHFINTKQLKELSACWNDKNNARAVQEYCGRTVLVRQKSNYSVA